MANNDYWEQLRQPPVQALKKITGGRLNGMTDINPQWRLQAMTEVFGPCGIGWKYEIDRQWTEPASEDQVMAFCNVNLYILDPNSSESMAWGAPIPGTGGSMMITKERSGLHSSDECWKMALTDALSVAMKALGMAADIYLGAFDGSKYLRKAPEKQEAKQAAETPVRLAPKTDDKPAKKVIEVSTAATPDTLTPPANDTFTEDDDTVNPRAKFKFDSDEVKVLWERCQGHGIDKDLFKFICQNVGIKSWTHGIGRKQLADLEGAIGIEIIDSTYSKKMVEAMKKESE